MRCITQIVRGPTEQQELNHTKESGVDLLCLADLGHDSIICPRCALSVDSSLWDNFTSRTLLYCCTGFRVVSRAVEIGMSEKRETIRLDDSSQEAIGRGRE